VEASAGSWLGQRSGNEDRVYADGPILALFDGIGGRAFGYAAASIALSEVVRQATVDRLTGRIDVASTLGAADKAVRQVGASLGVHIGTTAVVVLLEVLDGQLLAHVGWAGDSAAYLLRGNDVATLTDDHADGPLIDGGLAAWLGSGDHLAPRNVTHQLRADDTLILVSDGVAEVLDNSTIGWLTKSAPSAHAAVDVVLNAAASKGASDNCSVVVATVHDMVDVGRHRVLTELRQLPNRDVPINVTGTSSVLPVAPGPRPLERTVTGDSAE